jgi:acetone carboxylase gamma subunit
MTSEVPDDMNQHRFFCPECASEHDQPAEATYVVAVLCLDCELEARYAEILREPLIAEAA